MAKTPSKSVEPIDDDATYWVELNAVVDRGNGVFLKPGKKIKVSGRLLKELGGAVASYQLKG
ncbi:hypothetical protein [Chelatococcus sp.]|uniref:hypothetical protein n=1 Tax=Chelatococcus sp. TaxID=1953771 RepID=UPI001ED58E09|nr:hypothetical protein [Chelatococcus sp.]MBX3545595.1 hypothetical protein [Chelatococcus sp.]